ncbi:energy transducer TonB [Hymenobacter daeguensis]
MALLCGLPLAAHALSDTIVTDVLKVLVLVVVGGIVVVLLVLKVVALFIKTLQEGENPAAPALGPVAKAPPLSWPTAVAAGGAARFRWRLVARVALLGLLPNLFWLYESFSILLLRADQPLATSTTRLLLLGALYFLPAVVLAIWLWRRKRPSTALGIVLSSLLLAAGLFAFASRRRSEEAAKEQAIIDVTPPPDSSDATRVLDHADQMPTFPGGADSLRANLRHRVRYPELPRADQVSGRVCLRYVVGIDGRVYSPEVTQGMGGGAFDDEALRAVQELTFGPARQNGQIVAVYDTISIVFRKPLSAYKAW